MIPNLSSLSLPVRWTLQKFRPPSRKRLLLLEAYSAEGSPNLGCSYRLEPGEPVVAPGNGRVIGIRLVFPTWRFTPGTLIGVQPTFEITLDHGNDVWTVVHGVSNCVVQTNQYVRRGALLGQLLTQELFLQVKWLGTPYDPASVSRHFRTQDGTYAVGQTGYVRGADDHIQSAFVSQVRQIIVNGIHYFVNIAGVAPFLANIDFNGAETTETKNRGQLAYTGFANWDVVDNGSVDLIGNGYYDIQPGNGLYVDMSGSGDAGGSMSWYGRLQSKTSFTFTNGESFKLSWRSAGNLRFNRSHEILNYKAGALVDATIDITNWQQPFTDYSVTFTGDGSSGKISFRKIALETDPGQAYGSLLDSIKLENLTQSTVLLSDDFDTENPITTSRYTGPAVVGTTGDFWNVYTPAVFTEDYRTCYCGSYGTSDQCFTYSSTPAMYLKDSQQQDTLAWLERVAPLGSESGVSPSWNGMLKTWIGGYFGVPFANVFRLHGVPPGTYNLYLYSDQTSYGNGSDYYAQVDDGPLLHAATVPSGVTSWVQNNNYVLFPSLTVVPGTTIRIEALGFLAGLQLHRV